MRVVLVLLVLAAAAVAVVGCVAYEPAIAPVEMNADARRDPALIARGASLAAIGSCRGCHTARDGAPLAGGVPVHSPFGVIYSTNISPDPETGIGRWSEAAFRRAMRQGISRDGSHLYPAFPYERYTRAVDEDIAAIYAWLMAQPPVRSRPPKNELAFPFNLREGIALWKLAFLDEGPKGPSAHEARGDYLVDSLGHCGSCHSPRNWAYAEDMERELAGGEAEGWHAYALTPANKAVLPWTVEALTHYLRTGFHPRHGISRGTMGLVTAELAYADAADVEAMARAVVARMQPGRAGRQAWAQAVERSPLMPKGKLAEGEGAVIYRTSCLGCHDGARPLPFGGLPLALSTGLSGESPRNLVNVILHGIDPAGHGDTSPMMPGYAGVLSDAQVRTLVAWLRENLTDQPPWNDVGKHIAESRRMTPSMLRYPPGGAGANPAITEAR